MVNNNNNWPKFLIAIPNENHLWGQITLRFNDSTLFSSQRCLTPINISKMDTNMPNTQPTIVTKKTPPKLLNSKATAPLSDVPALDLKIWLLFFY